MNSTFILSAPSDGAAHSATAASARKRDMMAPGESEKASREREQPESRQARIAEPPVAHAPGSLGGLLHLNDPHVAVHDGVAVVLELERAGRRVLLLTAG